MIEALITTKDAGGFTKGDVICVKLAGAIWGNEERKYHQIVEWEDPVLEAKLQGMGEFAVISNPYIEAKPIETPRGTRYRITKMSTKYVDLDLIPDGMKADVISDSVDAGILEKTDIVIKEKTPDKDAVDFSKI